MRYPWLGSAARRSSYFSFGELLLRSFKRARRIDKRQKREGETETEKQ
jgi:hypothetical protein